MRKSAVLILGRVDTTTDSYKEFASRFECIHYEVTSLDKLLEDFGTKLAHIEAIFANWAGFASIGGFRGKAVTHAPPNLKLIATCQIGYEEFDTVAMRQRGIMLTNASTPLAYESVADLALYNAISSFRNFKFFERSFTQAHTTQTRNHALYGEFDTNSGQNIPFLEKRPPGFAERAYGRLNKSPKNHNAVIIGFGGIGKIVGQRLSSIGMNIHYVKRNPLSDKETAELGYKAEYHKSVWDTTKFADLIVVACPGNPSTKRMINEELIEAMEKPFRLINIGRGMVVDEAALVGGLKSGKVLFAGLDVFEEEPSVHPELLNRADVVLTPHIGSSTSELFYYAHNLCFRNINSVVNHNGEVEGLVN